MLSQFIENLDNLSSYRSAQTIELYDKVIRIIIGILHIYLMLTYYSTILS